MNKYLLWLIWLIVLPVCANETTDIHKGNPDQKKVITNLEQAIGKYHLAIQLKYKYIYQSGLIKNNTTRIPLISERQNMYQRKQKHIYNSEALIHWNANKIITLIHFKERDAIFRTFNQIRREWMGQGSIDGHDAKANVTGYSIDFFTYNVGEYGNRNTLLFRLNTATDTKDASNFFDIPKNDIKPVPKIRYVESPQLRIDILHEYLKLMTLLEHRINYFTRAVQSGAESKLKYLLP